MEFCFSVLIHIFPLILIWKYWVAPPCRGWRRGKVMSCRLTPSYRREDTFYRFRLDQRGNMYRCMILRSPKYRRRSRNWSLTHRIGCLLSPPYICWTEPIRSASDARTICRLWAEHTQQYIRTGRF